MKSTTARQVWTRNAPSLLPLLEGGSTQPKSSSYDFYRGSVSPHGASNHIQNLAEFYTLAESEVVKRENSNPRLYNLYHHISWLRIG